jgi:hypothetical protein
MWRKIRGEMDWIILNDTVSSSGHTVQNGMTKHSELETIWKETAMA